MMIYEKNMQAIKEYHKRLYEYMETAVSSNPVEICYETAENGRMYPIVIKDGMKYSLNSRYNPEKASIQYVSQFEKKNAYSVFFIAGF